MCVICGEVKEPFTYDIRTARGGGAPEADAFRRLYCKYGVKNFADVVNELSSTIPSRECVTHDDVDGEEKTLTFTFSVASSQSTKILTNTVTDIWLD